jgi:hypothetical protein
MHLHHKIDVLHRALLHGKLPRSLHWNDALELFQHIGEVQPTDGGEFAFVVGTQKEFFRRPHGGELGVEEVSRLRRLLKAAAPGVTESAVPSGARMVVVIDHHAAHIFRTGGLDGLKHEVTLEPYDPHHFHHHLIHRKEAHYRGDRVPEDHSFYEEVCKTLAPAREIILIGHSSGKSSALDVLSAYLKKHHAELARRVVATETADLSALTEPETAAIARRHLDPPSLVARS